MRTSTLFTCMIICLVQFVAGCSGDSDTHIPAPPTVRFLPTELTVDSGSTFDLLLQIENIEPSVFSLSFQVSYGAQIVTFDDSSGLVPGSFFSAEALYFVHHDDSLIYLTISNLRGQPLVTGGGELCGLHFIAAARGSTRLSVAHEQLEFYDENGNAVVVDDLELGAAAIHVN